jgi:hypothetical protein
MRGNATAGREERSGGAVDKVGDGGADEVGDGSSDGEDNVGPTAVSDGNRGIKGAGQQKIDLQNPRDMWFMWAIQMEIEVAWCDQPLAAKPIPQSLARSARF